LPESVKKSLSLRASSSEYTLSTQDPSPTWLEIHRQLSEVERDFVVAFILREGVLTLLKRLDYPDEPVKEVHRG